MSINASHLTNCFLQFQSLRFRPSRPFTMIIVAGWGTHTHALSSMIGKEYPSPSHCLSLSSLPISLSLSLSHTHVSLYLYLFISLTHTHTHISLSLSLSHTHTHTYISLSLTPLFWHHRWSMGHTSQVTKSKINNKIFGTLLLLLLLLSLLLLLPFCSFRFLEFEKQFTVILNKIGKCRNPILLINSISIGPFLFLFRYVQSRDCEW